MSKIRLEPGKKLNDQMERFCQEYVVSHNGKEAAIAAGYKESDARQRAYDLRHYNQAVKDRIAELEAENAERLGITKVDIRNDIQEILDDPKTTTSSRLRAIRLKGQLIGAFTERVDHTLTMSDEMIKSMQRVLDSE